MSKRDPLRMAEAWLMRELRKAIRIMRRMRGRA
jgi:hypothetical protein